MAPKACWCFFLYILLFFSSSFYFFFSYARFFFSLILLLLLLSTNICSMFIYSFFHFTLRSPTLFSSQCLNDLHLPHESFYFLINFFYWARLIHWEKYVGYIIYMGELKSCGFEITTFVPFHHFWYNDLHLTYKSFCFYLGKICEALGLCHTFCFCFLLSEYDLRIYPSYQVFQLS